MSGSCYYAWLLRWREKTEALEKRVGDSSRGNEELRSRLMNAGDLAADRETKAQDALRMIR